MHNPDNDGLFDPYDTAYYATGFVLFAAGYVALLCQAFS